MQRHVAFDANEAAAHAVPTTAAEVARDGARVQRRVLIAEQQAEYALAEAADLATAAASALEPAASASDVTLTTGGREARLRLLDPVNAFHTGTHSDQNPVDDAGAVASVNGNSADDSPDGCDDATCGTSVAGDAPTAGDSDSDGPPYSFRTDGTRRPGPCGREDCEFAVDGDPDTCAICYEAWATAERLRQAAGDAGGVTVVSVDLPTTVAADDSAGVTGAGGATVSGAPPAIAEGVPGSSVDPSAAGDCECSPMSGWCQNGPECPRWHGGSVSS